MDDKLIFNITQTMCQTLECFNLLKIKGKKDGVGKRYAKCGFAALMVVEKKPHPANLCTFYNRPERRIAIANQSPKKPAME